MKTLTVIVSQDGRVVATRLGHAAHVDAKSGIRSELVARSGQTRHEIEIDVPDEFRSKDELERFHAKVQAHVAGLSNL
jgi:hypothetical protein